ncbi:segregation/condensation protein A [Streptomyces sp. G2]|uniref:segregation and condensation protein A n=1 Tax=Streptomyces TaxID=1883 RepID=UPI00202DE88E|nr:ScpA family protein [Streptomyces sp. G2]MCM1948465.1 segregation/condensation protein A [Streptomyces sp. G2]
MHQHADETSRPPRRRALGRGGGVSGTGQEPPTAAAPAPEPPTGPTRAPEPQPAPTEPEPEPTEPEPTATEPEPTATESGSTAPRPGSEPDEGPGGVPAAEGPEGVPGGVPAAEGPEGVPGGAPAAEEPEGAPGDAPAAGGGVAGGRFTVRLANFEGPFDLLLQLITKHKLDVTEVALSQVTDEFMAHLRGLGPDGDLDQTTEFLVVAATLLDLKTARLLPAAEVEDEADLALLEARDLLFARLLQYRAYKRIAEIFAERWEAEGRRHPRTVGLEPHHAELLPEVVLTIGAEGLAKLAVKAMRPRAAPQVYVDHIHAPLVSVREQAGIVAALLRERGTLDFRELVEDAAGDTLTVVARFLALLELYREKAVALDQEDALGRLTVSWTGGDGEARVTQEFDQEDPSA